MQAWLGAILTVIAQAAARNPRRGWNQPVLLICRVDGEPQRSSGFGVPQAAVAGHVPSRSGVLRSGRAADGTVRHSPPIQEGFTQIPLDAVEKWLADNGVSHSQVIGFVHNHPTYSYGGTDEAVSINSYPSQNDWGFADYMVAKGAGGTGGTGFALYVINPDKELREFHYSDAAVYRNLSTTQKENEIGLPVQLVDDGTSC